MSDFGFVGASYQAASITQDDQECINWYPEVDMTKQQGERGVMALLPTPGLTVKCTPAVAEVRGLYTIPGGSLALAVVGSGLYKINTSYTATLVGTLLSVVGNVSITSNATAAYIVDGLNRYSYNWTSGAFAVVSDGPFTGAEDCDEVDNFIVYSRLNSNQWGSTDAGVTTSNALNLGSMVGNSNNIVAIIADHRQILLLGEQYSERWINVGTFPFSFGVIPGSSIQHGCQSKDSVSRLGEGIAFLALDTRGNSTVVMWGAAVPQPQRISTFAVENAIQSYAVTSDAIAYTYTQSGHEFYVLTFPTADVTWVYDASTQLWHKRAWRDSNGILHRHRSNCCTVFNGQILVGDYQNGNIYALDQHNYTDNGDAIARVRRCRHLTSDLKRQYFNDIQIQFQPGVGLQAGQGSNPQFILRWSDDGGNTWGNDHFVSIGKVGQYKNRAIKRRLGYSRDRIFEVEMTDPVWAAIVSANLNASAGAN